VFINVLFLHVHFKMHCELLSYNGQNRNWGTLCIHTTTVLRLFFRDHPGEPVPEESFWTLWCKGRLTEANTLTIRLGATPSGLTSAYLTIPPSPTLCIHTIITTLFPWTLLWELWFVVIIILFADVHNSWFTAKWPLFSKVSVCLSVCLFVQSFSQPSLIRFRSN